MTHHSEPQGEPSDAQVGDMSDYTPTCPHEYFTSVRIGRGMERMTCDECGKTTEVLSATAQADIEEWSME